MDIPAQTRHRIRLESLGTAAAAIAHEFNNVLASVVLLVEAAVAGLPADSAACSDLARALEAARRGRNLAQRILNLSIKPDDIALQPVDLGAVTEECARLFAVLAPKDIQIRTVIADGLPPVWADAPLVVDLLTNLCGNALRAMRGASGVLTLELAAGEAAGRSPARRVELQVRDTGHGISEQNIARMFEPFFTTRTAVEGTGLGLALVRAIVVRFGAQMVVESASSGTTIRILFAVVEGDAPPGQA